jgi:hypothetical protein
MSGKKTLFVMFGTGLLFGAMLFAAGEKDPNAIPNTTPDVNLPASPWTVEDTNSVSGASLRARLAAGRKAAAQLEGQLTSSLDSMSLYRLGKRLYTAGGAGAYDDRIAMVFMNAAVSLDQFSPYALQDSIYLKTRLSVKEEPAVMWLTLSNYLDRRADTEVARGMVRYLLEDINSREGREQMLADLFKLVADRNRELGSDIAVEQGLLAAERGDVKSAASRFMVALSLNPYSELASSKLAEAGQGQLLPVFYASQQRQAMAKNPLDLQAVLAFAAFMEGQELYATAASAYEYAEQLYQHLYPGQKMQAEIYVPLSLCCFNQEGKADKCIEIADAVRKAGDFDVVAESIAMKAAEKQGMAEKVKEIGARIEAKLGGGADAAESAQRAAWYYSFVAKDGGKALSWANKAYAADPNSGTGKSLLVYALVINGQAEVAAEMVKETASGAGTSQVDKPQDQITGIAMGVKLLGEQKKDETAAILKAAIEMRSGSLEAAEAKQLLAYNGASYAGVDKVTDDMTATLKGVYGEALVPRWTNPDKILSIKLQSRSEDSQMFGADLNVELSVTNNWSGPVIIGDGGLFGGNIRIDGRLRGDMEKTFPWLVTRKIGRGAVIQPGRSLIVPLDLNLNGVYDALLEYPQANMEIVFTAYMDAVEDGGKVRNRMAGMAPGQVTIEKKGVKPVREFVTNRLDTLAKGSQSQKVQAARMFASLLRERMAIEKGQVKYAAMKLEPALLKSAVIRGLDDESWTVKMQTMSAMAGMEMDFDLTNSVAQGLQNKYWPVRLMSVYLLGSAQSGDFDKVLKWYIENDKDGNVKKMAEVLAQRNKERKTTAK